MRGINRYSVLSVAITVVMLLSGMLAEAHMYHGKDRGSMMGHFLKGLDLSVQQKQQIKGIMQSHRNDMLAGKVAVLQARQNLLAATTSGTFDAEAVQTAYSALSAAQQNMTVLRAEIFSQVMPVLTPDQQAVVKNKVAKISQRMQQTIAKLQAKSNPPPPSNP